jgi:hypothetical protein
MVGELSLLLSWAQTRPCMHYCPGLGDNDGGWPWICVHPSRPIRKDGWTAPVHVFFLYRLSTPIFKLPRRSDKHIVPPGRLLLIATPYSIRWSLVRSPPLDAVAVEDQTQHVGLSAGPSPRTFCAMGPMALHRSQVDAQPCTLLGLLDGDATCCLEGRNVCWFQWPGVGWTQLSAAPSVHAPI